MDSKNIFYIGLISITCSVTAHSCTVQLAPSEVSKNLFQQAKLRVSTKEPQDGAKAEEEIARLSKTNGNPCKNFYDAAVYGCEYGDVKNDNNDRETTFELIRRETESTKSWKLYKVGGVMLLTGVVLGAFITYKVKNPQAAVVPVQQAVPAQQQPQEQAAVYRWIDGFRRLIS